MSSTNKTTNYELSQYIGTDKPTYLGDYNSDMSKIDTAIHNNKVAVDGTESDITLINEKIGNLSNLNTSEKSNIVGAINEVKVNADLITKFNLVNSTVYSSVSSSSNCNYKNGSITLITNDDNSIFKLYGNMKLQLTNNTDTRVDITLPSNLNPSQEYSIDPICGVFSSDGNFLGTAFCEVKTNGNLVIAYWGGKSHGEEQILYLTPCLYFNKNFGDQPNQ